MASHYEIRPDQSGLAMRIAQKALRVANGLSTSRPGNVYIPNKDENGISDGTGTWIGSGGIGDGGVMPWLGDTTPPGKPTGVSATSAWGVVYATWDGTLDGGVPSDFAYVSISIDGSEIARLTGAGKVAAYGYSDGQQVTVSFVAYDAARDPETGELSPNASQTESVSITVVDEKSEIEQSVQNAESKADELAQQVQQVETTVNGVQQDVSEITSQVSGAVEAAGEALTEATSAQQDISGFKTTVEQTYETKSDAEASMAQEVLDRNSAIEQSASSVLTQVSENYVDNETGATYATKSYVDQQDGSITTTVSEAVTTANGAMEKATTAEQTASGFEARISAVENGVTDAAKTATNYLGFSTDGLVVGTNSDGSGQSGLQGNVRLYEGGMEVRNGTDVLANYGASKVELGKNSTSSVVDMCSGALRISRSGNNSAKITNQIVGDNNSTVSIESGGASIVIESRGAGGGNPSVSIGTDLVVPGLVYPGETSTGIGVQEIIDGVGMADRAVVLWSGAGWYMNGNQTATLSQSVSSQAHGIVLHWQYYSSGAAQNQNHYYFFVPKTHVSSYSGAGTSFLMSNGNVMCKKYLYISDTQVKGHDDNSDTSTGSCGVKFTNNYWVLTQIIGV